MNTILLFLVVSLCVAASARGHNGHKHHEKHHDTHERGRAAPAKAMAKSDPKQLARFREILAMDDIATKVKAQAAKNEAVNESELEGEIEAFSVKVVAVNGKIYTGEIKIGKHYFTAKIFESLGKIQVKSVKHTMSERGDSLPSGSNLTSTADILTAGGVTTDSVAAKMLGKFYKDYEDLVEQTKEKAANQKIGEGELKGDIQVLKAHFIPVAAYVFEADIKIGKYKFHTKVVVSFDKEDRKVDFVRQIKFGQKN